MGSFDGAETCEHPVKTRYDTSKSSLGLYRADGLALLRNLNRQQTDKVKKNIIRVLSRFFRRFI